MTAIHMHKVNGCLVPSDDAANDYLRKLKTGETVSISVKRQRNYQLLKKWFALLEYAFDYWEPEEPLDDPEKKWLKNVVPRKNFKRFRQDITILAGYYDASFRLDGSVRIEAKSISFGSMSEDDFEKLYSATINVILDKVLTDHDEETLNGVVDQIMSFA